MRERVVHGSNKFIDITTTAEVDDRSTIQINFDPNKMMSPDAKGANVTIRLAVFALRGSTLSEIAPIPNYVDSTPQPPAPKSPTGSTGGSAITYHDKTFDPSASSTVPATYLDLESLGIADADKITVVIRNIETAQEISIQLYPRKFGLRAKASDTVMFVKRLGVGKTDVTNGINEFNFGPSPGVVYGGTYFARDCAIMRFLQPGVGVDVLFTKWDNPAFDIATGKFVPGTQGSDIQIAVGGQISLFDGVVQAGYGANLQVDRKRQYFSLGFSFINLTSKIAGLVGK
jgi:hypothetical protein